MGWDQAHTKKAEGQWRSRHLTIKESEIVATASQKTSVREGDRELVAMEHQETTGKLNRISGGFFF